jgi:hypothetical protein
MVCGNGVFRDQRQAHSHYFTVYLPPAAIIPAFGGEPQERQAQ